jgi:DNA repair exonuclease SbcCD nuclease subunit
MYSCIRVGDPHVKYTNLTESQKIIDFTIEKAKEYKTLNLEFLGDLFHTHAILRMEVLDFWHKNFIKLKDLGYNVKVLVGNHDVKNIKNPNEMHSLNVFKHIGITIIDKPIRSNNIVYLPYYHNTENFIKDANALADDKHQCLVTHMTIAKDSNVLGYYDDKAINPDDLNFFQIISGHIHTSQQLDKCTYIGTPKWDTMSDANVSKYIWYQKHEDNGRIIDCKVIDTKKVVSPIYKIIVNEGDEEPKLYENARTYLEFRGKTSWLKEMKKKYKGQCSIKIVPLDRKVDIIKVSNLKLKDFLEDYFIPSETVTKSDIDKYLKGLQ